MVGELTQCGANLNDSALFVASRAPGDDDQNHQQDCDDQDFQGASPPTMLAGRGRRRAIAGMGFDVVQEYKNVPTGGGKERR